MTGPGPACERGTCVLIVDDDQDERNSLRDVVEMLGLSSMTAKIASAEDALAILADSQPCRAWSRSERTTDHVNELSNNDASAAFAVLDMKRCAAEGASGSRRLLNLHIRHRGIGGCQ